VISTAASGFNTVAFKVVNGFGFSRLFEFARIFAQAMGQPVGTGVLFALPALGLLAGVSKIDKLSHSRSTTATARIRSSLNQHCRQIRRLIDNGRFKPALFKFLTIILRGIHPQFNTRLVDSNRQLPDFGQLQFEAISIFVRRLRIIRMHNLNS
jgi:hypothetical protein